MKKNDLPIADPCHENWDAMDPRERGRFCNSCEKQVFDLTSMTKDKVKSLMRENAGQRICVRYHYDDAGELRFRAPEPTVVPIGRLTARRRRVAAPAIAAAGLAIAMAACTPHDGDRVEPNKPTVTETEKPDFQWRDIFKPFVPEREPQPEVVMGMMVAPPEDVPCEKPEPTVELHELKGDIAVPEDFEG